MTLDEAAPDIRPGFTCTAEISTASRANAVAVPIQALTVRELEYDKAGAVVPKVRPAPASRFSFGAPEPSTATTAPSELPVGHTRKEVEGVFVIRDGRPCSPRSRSASPANATSRSRRALKEGDRVITGPFESVRNLFDADEVRENRPAATTAK